MINVSIPINTRWRGQARNRARSEKSPRRVSLRFIKMPSENYGVRPGNRGVVRE